MLLSELKARGLLAHSSPEEKLQEVLEKKPTFYIGFDPTAESLHIGNLLAIVLMKRLEKAGLRPIVLVGGGTGLIGDPSGKLNERTLESEKVVRMRAEKIKKQLSRFFQFSRTGAIFDNNIEWLGKISLVSFLRDVGKYFQINDMIGKEMVKSRLETGISFTEFTYMALQSYDFFMLHKKYGCTLQAGGSDQWGNISAGIDYIRKSEGKEVYGLTIPLITKADGSKFGKSEKGAIWLDAEKTSPYHFYQFWLNVDDADVIKFMKFFTFLSLEEIKAYEEKMNVAPEKREAQKALAEAMTTFVHGEKYAERAEEISQILFYGTISDLKKSDLEAIYQNAEVKTLIPKNPILLPDVLVEVGVVMSKRQAKEDLENGAISINGEKIQDTGTVLEKDDFLYGKYCVIRRGKKDFHFISL